MLKIENISKTFDIGTPSEKKALSNLSLHVKKGDFITVIGSNGAGKSTLFNAIAGNFIIDSGYIYIDGKDVTVKKTYERAKYIGRLFQDPLKGTAPDMTIEENLFLACGHGGWLASISKEDREKFVEELGKLNIGLENIMKQKVGLLSGGQRQALTLMMATINPPLILLLDEHTAALDPATADKVLNLTKDIVKKHNLTCLMITHNMQQALEIGNRTIMMENGNIIFDVEGDERKNMTVDDLLEEFRKKSGKVLDNDRMRLS